MNKQRLQKLAGILTEASTDPMRQILLYPLFEKAFKEMDKSSEINNMTLARYRSMDMDVNLSNKWNTKVEHHLREAFPAFNDERIEVLRDAYWDYRDSRGGAEDVKRQRALRSIFFNNKREFPQKWEYYTNIYGT
jgi:hypothetical protein